MLAEFKHLINQKYLGGCGITRLKCMYDITRILRAAQKCLTRLPPQTSFICMAWPGEEPEQNSINLYAKKQAEQAHL